MSERVLVVAGEASGDLHAARLMAELKRLRPAIEFFGLGGDEMAREGLSAVAHSSEVAVVGIFEALHILKRARQVFELLLAEAERRRPQVAVLVDFPEFNLRMARQLKRRGISVVYYISPQIWAWRRRRVKTIRDVVSKMLVLFPFEREFYRQHGVSVVHVGHPLVDEVPQLERKMTGNGSSDRSHTVALLPGSRRSEIEALLPVMLDAVRMLRQKMPVRPRLILAPTVPEERVSALLVENGNGLDIDVVRDDRFSAIAAADLALCASGTATLEVGLLGTPLIVVYRVGFLTSVLARLLVRVPHIALVNLVLGERVAPELVQGGASPHAMAEKARELLEGPELVSRMTEKLATLREALGEPGASRRAAQEVLAVLDEEEATA